MSVLFRNCLALAAYCLVILSADPGWAKWPHTPQDQIIVHQEPVDSYAFTNAMTTDGDGGVIVIYSIQAGASDVDLKAQRYDRNGNPQWPQGGITVCTAPGYQYQLKAVPDDLGGCFLAWTDLGGTFAHIYGQHITHSGEVLWGVSGQPLISRDFDDQLIDMVKQPGGGFILLFLLGDFTHGQSYLQKFDENGNSVWPLFGRVPYGPESRPQCLISDGAGGACALLLDYSTSSRKVVMVGVTSDAQTYFRVLRQAVGESFLNVNMIRRNANIITATWREAGTENSGMTIDFDRQNPTSVFPLQTGSSTLIDVVSGESAFGDPLVAVSYSDDDDLRIGRLGSAGQIEFFDGLTFPPGTKIPAGIQETGSGRIRFIYEAKVPFSSFQFHTTMFDFNGHLLWDQSISPADGRSYSLLTEPVAGNNESNYNLLTASNGGNEFLHVLTRIRPDGTLGGEPVDAPMNLHVTGASSTQIGLAWNDAAINETGYYVARSADGVNWLIPGALPADTGTFLDAGLLSNHGYLYGVLAYNAFSEEYGWSPFIPAATSAPLPELTYDPGDLFVTGKKTKIKMLGNINIRNAGTAPSSACALQFHLSTEPRAGAPGDQFMFQVDVPALAAGQVVSLQPGLRPPKKPGGKRKKLKIKMPKGTVVAGKFVVGVVDWGNLVPESNEANNVYVVYGL